MKKTVIILFFILFLISCGEKENIENSNNLSGKKEMLSSPNGGGNTGSFKNDSFRK